MAEKKKAEDKRPPYEVAMNQLENRFRYLCKKDILRGKVSYNDLDTVEILGEEMIPDRSLVSVEDAVVEKLMCEKLHQGLLILSVKENKMVQALHFENLSGRQFTDRTGVPQKTINNRKKRALDKLRKFFENKK